MKIEALKSRHLPKLREWFEHYGMPVDLSLPQIGFVAIEEEPIAAPIAAAFLRRIEGGLGLFDGLIADPKAFGKKRSGAIDAVVKRLLTEARNLDISKIIAYSTDSAVIRRSLKHGFEMQPDQFIALKI